MTLVKGVYPGDTLTVKGVVTDKIPEGNAMRLVLDVWLENQAEASHDGHGERPGDAVRRGRSRLC